MEGGGGGGGRQSSSNIVRQCGGMCRNLGPGYTRPKQVLFTRRGQICQWTEGGRRGGGHEGWGVNREETANEIHAQHANQKT